MNPWSPAMFPSLVDIFQVTTYPGPGGERKENLVPRAAAVPCSIQEFTPTDLMMSLGAIGSKETAIAYMPHAGLAYVPRPGDRIRDRATGRTYTVVQTVDESNQGSLWAVHLSSTT